MTPDEQSQGQLLIYKHTPNRVWLLYQLHRLIYTLTFIVPVSLVAQRGPLEHGAVLLGAGGGVMAGAAHHQPANVHFDTCFNLDVDVDQAKIPNFMWSVKATCLNTSVRC